MLNVKRAFLFVLVSLIAVGAMASNFRAGDLVYLPVAGRVQGATLFKTDVWVSNLDTVNRVTIDVAYAPRGADNRNVTASLIRLATLNPGERREFVDVFGPGGLNISGNPFGQLLFFACREGGNCASCDTNPADCKLISVESRIYAENTGANCPGSVSICTNGQDMPGIPWYNYASVDSQDRGLHRVFLTGFRVTGAPGQAGTYRSNLGLTNASQFSSTTLRVTLFNAAGQSQGSRDIQLPPLSHFQDSLSAASLFPNFSGSGAWVTVEQVSVAAIPGQEANALPGFFAYGSVLDNIGSDPTTLEAQYFPPLEFSCVYGTKPQRRPARR